MGDENATETSRAGNQGGRMSRPSSGMTLDELRDEYDWMYEFQSRMAERIRDDADVHNLADYVTKLRAENAKLRELCVKALGWLRWAGGITCPPEVPDEFADELRELGVEVD